MSKLRVPWWKDYRRRMYGRREKMSLEMIFRKSLKEAATEFVHQSSLGGMKQIFDGNIGVIQRLIWIAIFFVTFAVISYFLQYVWFDTVAKPLIVTMESSTYPISLIDFPAIAFCNVNRLSRKAVVEYSKYIHSFLARNNETLEEVEWFNLQTGKLLDYTYDEVLRNHPFLDILAKHVFDTSNIVARMKELAPSCDDMLLKCTWAAIQVNCSSIFTTRRTVRGHCCAFNVVYEFNAGGRPNKTIVEVKRQEVSGVLNGLNVVLDPMIEDYAYPLSSVEGFDVFVFDPAHFADPSGGRVIQRSLQVNSHMYFELQSIKQVATKEVRQYPVKMRKCLFHDERREQFGDMYSYSGCIANCRIKAVQSLCKCTPYFMPTRGDGPICTLDDLFCLNKYKEKFLYLHPIDALDPTGLEMELQDSIFCPECLPDCELTKHHTRSAVIPLTEEQWAQKWYIRKFFSGVNLTNKCAMTLYQSTGDGTLDRLDVVVYWFEILSNIGGFSGVLVGFSIIGVVECIYFLLVRFSQKLYENMNTNK